MLHEAVLSPRQKNLSSTFLPHFLDFFLVGGTAIALLLGHRRSVDFDAKLFLEQLCYFEDIDFSEEMDYFGIAPDTEEIRTFLINCVRII